MVSVQSFSLETIIDPPKEVTDPIDDGLTEFNRTQLGPDLAERYHHFAITARDAAGQIVGGIIGDFVWNFMHIEVLWVAETLRGQDLGTRLLQQAEAEARARRLDLIVLETISFQALPFYQKKGFEVVGSIPDMPPGHTWYYMKKWIRDEGKP